MLAASDHEIRYVDAALHLDVLQRALKFIFRGEHSSNAVEDAKIGILEVVLTRDGSLAVIAGVPRTELAVGANLTGRERVVERDDVKHRFVEADGGQLQCVNIEAQRGVGIGAGNFDGCAVGNDLSDPRSGAGFLPGGCLHGSSSRWNTDAKTIQNDAREIAGTQKEVNIAGFDGETLNRHDRSGARQAAEPFENETLADTARMREVGGVKSLEGDGRGETRL